MPAAHGDEALHRIPSAGELGFERAGLGFGFRQNRRTAAQLFVDLPRQWRALCRNVPCKRPANETGQVDDCRIAEQVSKEWLHGRERIRPAEVEQHHGEFHIAPLMRAMSRSTFATGVSGRMPWPRLKMKARPRVWLRMSSTARSSASPPAISTMGSRLPWTTVPLGSASAAHRIDAAVSMLTASTPVSSA